MRHSPGRRPSPLDPRADSPMSETILVEDSPVNGNIPHGLASPRTEAPTSGFTAVNGDNHRHSTAFRPGDSTKISITTFSNGDAKPSMDSNALLNERHHSHGWRPDERGHSKPSKEPYHISNGTTNKRKRSDSGPDSQDRNDAPPPSLPPADELSERHMASFDPSPRMSSPGLSDQSRVRSRGRESEPHRMAARDVREPSPVMRKNAGEPPPAPQPDIAATLAESLHPKVESPRARQGSQPISLASPTTPSTPAADIDEVDDFDAPEHRHINGGGVPDKKRKRVFSNRTKTGCHTCRSRKKKCDEAKPTCLNCNRGGFVCSGYGPKPPGGTRVQHQHKQMVPLQSKQHYEPSHGPTGYYEGGPRGSPPTHYAQWPDHRVPVESRQASLHYGQMPHFDRHPPPSRDRWYPGWGPPEVGPGYPSDRAPPSGYPPLTPSAHVGPDHRAHQELWGPGPRSNSYRPRSGPSTTTSAHDSVMSSSGGSMRAPMPLGLGPGSVPRGGPDGGLNGGLPDKWKMLMGKPYKHYTDDELMRDSKNCKKALEEYNSAAQARSTVSAPEKERLFHQILDPGARTWLELRGEYRGPKGTIGSRTLVETPINCEFGYNVHLGDDILISANCLLQDANEIHIGSRTIVGPNVSFLCMTTSVDPLIRQGNQGIFVAGAIHVEEDCFIGAGATILPYRTIGKGAVVAAGAVVTKDVKPYTIVRGNPAKFVRTIEPGPNVDRHLDPDIQEQNERMEARMRENVSLALRQ